MAPAKIPLNIPLNPWYALLSCPSLKDQFLDIVNYSSNFTDIQNMTIDFLEKNYHIVHIEIVDFRDIDRNDRHC